MDSLETGSEMESRLQKDYWAELLGNPAVRKEWRQGRAERKSDCQCDFKWGATKCYGSLRLERHITVGPRCSNGAGFSLQQWVIGHDFPLGKVKILMKAAPSCYLQLGLRDIPDSWNGYAVKGALETVWYWKYWGGVVLWSREEESSTILKSCVLD